MSVNEKSAKDVFARQESVHGQKRGSNPPNSQIVEPAPPEARTRKGRKRTGKRSNPDYVQTGVYLPADLTKRVKRRLYGGDIDFSDLIAHLLEDWETAQATRTE